MDPRGPRVAAALTTVVLALVLLTGSAWLLAAQAAVFALGALVGVGATPYAWGYRRLVRPRLGPTDAREDPRPLRFAQGVGLGFALVGLVGYLSGHPLVGDLATAAAFVAAALNAVLGLCLGCEMYLLIRRVTHPSKETPA